eukprot:m.24964 g.24964  ORF g.24964 m.24964 type:complete len:644 (+) comp6137_c0_seq2:160-2091(+)
MAAAASADDGMSVTSLSDSPQFPCVLLQMPRLTILLDCALDTTTALNFLPLDLIPKATLAGNVWHGATQKTADGPPKVLHSVRSLDGRVLLHEPIEYRLPRFELVDVASIDIVLISSCHSMLALPYLTERTAFSGVIYATEPTRRFGLQMMEAMVAAETKAPRRPSRHGWKVPDVLAVLPGRALDALLWQGLYTAEEAAAAVHRCTAVSYNEKRVELGAVTITAHPSGYGIGAANWVLQTPEQRIVYVGASSGSSDRHPAPLHVESLVNADICIMSGFTQVPDAVPEQMVNEMLGRVIKSVADGSTALLPVHPTGVVLDLIELVMTRLAEAQLPTVPVFFVSPSAKASLSYANICGEWLCQSKTERIFMPEYPFLHAEYLSTKLLQVFPALTSEFTKAYREPCVIFADQPDLRSGPAAQLVKMLSGKPESCCVLTCPDYNMEALVAPYSRAKVKFLACPIDPALRPGEIRRLVTKLAPKTLAVHPAPDGGPLVQHKGGTAVDMPLGVPRALRPPEFERAVISEGLANTLVPVQVEHGMSAVGVTARLNHQNYKFELGPSEIHRKKKRRVLLGSLQTARVVQALAKRGFRDVAIEQRESADVIRLVAFDASIVLGHNHTDIIVEDNETLRQALRDSIVSLLTEL